MEENHGDSLFSAQRATSSKVPGEQRRRPGLGGSVDIGRVCPVEQEELLLGLASFISVYDEEEISL